MLSEYNKYLNIKNKTIPKILFQTHYNINEIPQKVNDNLKKFASGYKRILYNDQDCIHFITKNYNINVLKAFKKLKGAHKADLVRYCFLYKYGGVYLDIKIKLDQHLDKLFNKPYLYSVLSYIPNNIFQGVIATPKSNPIFINLIDFMIKVSKQDFIDYSIFTKDFYRNLHNITNKKLIEGDNGKDIFLFTEKCNLGEDLCDGLDKYGLCCNIFYKNNKIITTRYADYPW